MLKIANLKRNSAGFIAAAALLFFASAIHAEESLSPMPGTPPAPDFALKDVDGRTHRLSDLRGKVVLVNFWATWCPPCRKEMPSMQRAWEKLRKENFAMMAVDVGEDEDTVWGFSTPTPLEFTIVLDRDSSVTRKWPLRALPTTFILDTEGRIVYRAVGGREWDDPGLLKKIRALMRPDEQQKK